MSLRSAELALVVRELNERLQGAFVQKIFMPLSELCYLELRHLGGKALLCLSVEPEVARVSIARSRPALGPGNEPSFQRWLRQHLTRAKLQEISLWDERVTALRFDQSKGERTLVADLAHSPGTFLLLGEERRVLTSAGHAKKSAPAPGNLYQATASAQADSRPSRLVSVAGSRFPWAEAAEALLGDRQSERWISEIRRRLQRPLRSKLTRLLRTREKVIGDASRRPLADEHRRLGELISRNLHDLRRGMRVARLVEYTEQGPQEVEVSLSADRSPKEEAAWHFHQYGRLMRGCDHAARRLEELAREQSELQGGIEAIESMSADELWGHVRVLAPAPRRPQSISRPYKEYWSESGQRIWVGRSARDNEELTFRMGQPHHLWLHARGAPGSHVLVPIEKGVEAPQEVLLDAAHLALHHSSLKGERRGEVSYTQVKYVRRLKGSAPGTVDVTRERTMWVEAEPERLRRLLRSRNSEFPYIGRQS